MLALSGGMVGVEAAEFLARCGKQVTVVEILEEIARDINPVNRKLMMKRLTALPVELHTTTELVRSHNGRVFINYRGDQRELDQFDAVIVATGNRLFDLQSEQLQGAEFTVEVVSDADKPGTIYDAVRSGHEAGMTVRVLWKTVIMNQDINELEQELQLRTLNSPVPRFVVWLTSRASAAFA